MWSGQATLRSDLQRVDRLSDADQACLYNLALYWREYPGADFGEFEPGRGGRQLARRLRGAGPDALAVVVDEPRGSFGAGARCSVNASTAGTPVCSGPTTSRASWRATW
jgi:hypothetical protein